MRILEYKLYDTAAFNTDSQLHLHVKRAAAAAAALRC